MANSLLGLLVAAAALVLVGPQRVLVIAQDCPLDLSWPNFTLAASSCSNQNERPKCCRYVNAFVAVSVARYAKTTDSLAVPAALTDICLNSVLQSLNLYGLPLNASDFCGLGTKIRVSYQCQGRSTVTEMLQSPNFDDVVRNCKMPLSSETSCRRCLNSDIAFLRHLIGVQDNITLNTCRDAAFVALANQGDFSEIDLAGCFFSVKELIGRHTVNASEIPSPLLSPAASPSPAISQAPSKQLIAIPVTNNHHHFERKLIPGIGSLVTGLAIVLLIILLLRIRKKSRELKGASSATGEAANTISRLQVQNSKEGSLTAFRRFTYKEIKRGTNRFSSTIGSGGFATVYKAQFDDGSKASVKRMKRFPEHDNGEFYHEMELIGKLHHHHLVALRGFCLERQERFLIYEYMENGSLKDHLHLPDRTPLPWTARIRIAMDVANALEYLHFYCDPPLCHNDIKSGNILLDGDFLAKVADFGLARACPCDTANFKQVNKVIQVTPGYIDPEYVATQELTEKSDVYSFGVLLLELVTGRRAVQDGVNIVEWAHEFMLTDAKLPELVDPRIAYSFDIEQLRALIRIIQWCTERDGRMRPSIRQVIRLLYENLDPTHCTFLQAIENEEGRYNREGGASTSKSSRDETVIAFSGDARCLQSSSSTSRSYCSHSVLMESSPTESPTGISSV